MRLTEQIDALEVLGLSPLRELVAPRVAACMLSLPLLAVFIAFAAIGAGYLSESSRRHDDDHQVSARMSDAPDAARRAVVAVAHGSVWLPYRRDGLLLWADSTMAMEGLGRATTRAVVASIFLVFLADVVLVMLSQFVL